MRVFVAVALPQDLAGALGRVAQDLVHSGWRPVAPGNLHLTLRFLGERSPADVQALRARLAEALAEARGFEVELVGLGAFPRPEAPRVLWAGVGEGRERLAELAARVEGAVRALGWPAEERPFAAHLTLARRADEAREGAEAGRALVAAARGRRWGRFRVAVVEVFRSELRPGGPRYTPLGAVRLAPAGADGGP